MVFQWHVLIFKPKFIWSFSSRAIDSKKALIPIPVVSHISKQFAQYSVFKKDLVMGAFFLV